MRDKPLPPPDPARLPPPTFADPPVLDSGVVGSTNAGVLMGLLGNMLFGFISAVAFSSANPNDHAQWSLVWAFAVIGLSQIIWVAPAAIVLSVRGKSRTLAGLLITAGVIF
jgi:hypothetical protein